MDLIDSTSVQNAPAWIIFESISRDFLAISNLSLYSYTIAKNEFYYFLRTMD